MIKISETFQRLFSLSWKIALCFAAVLAFLLLKWEYFDTQQHDFTKSYYDKQFDLYSRLCAATGEISAAKTFEEAQRRAEPFYRLFYGELLLTSDLGVYNTSNSFRELLAGHAEMNKIRTAAATINARCRDSLRETSRPVVTEAIQNKLLQLSEELSKLTGAKSGG